MLDVRFYVAGGPFTAAELFVGCEIIGDAQRRIGAAADLAAAGLTDLAFVDGRLKEPVKTDAGAIVAPKALLSLLPDSATKIVSPHPRAAFAVALRKLVKERPYQMRGPAI